GRRALLRDRSGDLHVATERSDPAGDRIHREDPRRLRRIPLAHSDGPGRGHAVADEGSGTELTVRVLVEGDLAVVDLNDVVEAVAVEVGDHAIVLDRCSRVAWRKADPCEAGLTAEVEAQVALEVPPGAVGVGQIPGELV